MIVLTTVQQAQPDPESTFCSGTGFSCKTRSLPSGTKGVSLYEIVRESVGKVSLIACPRIYKKDREKYN